MTEADAARAGATYAFIGALVDELARSGVRHACIAPGSRSTPIALLLARDARVRTWMHVDERSAAFFALGLARRLDEPVALVCTSGTAAANFLPAIAEARQARVGLVVLTADRPPELRDAGAAQTIDQVRLYGAHAKWSVDVATPDASPALLRHARTLACRAVATARATPAGPVHLNLPLREPLVPVEPAPPADLDADDRLAWTGRADGAPWTRVHDGVPVVDWAGFDDAARRLRVARRPVIVCGPQPDALLVEPLLALARALRAPVLADPLSQLRWGPHRALADDLVIDAYDALLRDDATASRLAPDLVVRVGALPTSKVLQQWIAASAASAAPLLVVDASGWPEPSARATEVVHMPPAAWAGAMGGVVTIEGQDAAATVKMRMDRETWLETWCDADRRARAALDAHADAQREPFEGRVLRDAVAALPSHATLWVSSSMPVRDLDAFAAGDARPLHMLANRGANGIDGVVSSALGAAAGAREEGDGPLLLAIGDLAFYHDMNGLLAARLHALDATVLVVNNDGGGIFSFLPQATDADVAPHFEQLFGTPHGLDFAHAAALYGARFTRVTDHATLRAAIADALARPGLDVLEVRTDRARNVVQHRDAWAAVATALREADVADDAGVARDADVAHDA